MAWQYSNALNGALLAAGNGSQTDTFYKPYFSSYEPFTSRYQPKASNYFDRRSPPSFFDDLELELEVDDSILTSNRYNSNNRQHLYNNQPAYVPSYFNSLKTSLNNQNRNYETNNNINSNNSLYSESINQKVMPLNNLEQNQQASSSNDNLIQKPKPTYKPKKSNNNNNATPTNKTQVKKQVNPNLASKIQHNNNTNSYQAIQQQQQQQQIINNTPNFQRLFQPIPFQETPTIMNNINSVESSADLGSISNHNNQQLRFLQYQQRLLQQQEMNKNQSLSELEILKLKQQQDKQQLLQAIAANAKKEKQQHYQQQHPPFFDEPHLRQKQYSETSIPSTNADPLSNSPTPPLGVPNNRLPRVNFDNNPVLINNNKQQTNNSNTNNNNKMAQTKKGYYFKLSDNMATNNNNNKSSDDLPEIGSYMNTMRDARIREQRISKDKYTTQDYKQYQKNYGFGRDFLPFENETKKEKLEKARKREEYSKMIKERNAILMDGGGGGGGGGGYNPSMYSSNQVMQAAAPTNKRSFGEIKTKIKL